MNQDYEKLGEALYKAESKTYFERGIMKCVPWSELYEGTQQVHVDGARAVIAASGLLEEVERLRATVKRVEALSESLKAEGCLRGINNTIRARVGDQITEALKGPQ